MTSPEWETPVTSSENEPLIDLSRFEIFERQRTDRHEFPSEAPAPVVPDSPDVLGRAMAEPMLDAHLATIDDLGHTVAVDAEGEPVECVDECPACAADGIREALERLAVVGQGVTANRWGVYSYDDGRWYPSDPPTRRAAERSRELLRADGEACDVYPERVGQAMQNAVAHARHRAAVRPTRRGR